MDKIDFESFLRKKVDENKEPVNWEERKALWLDSIENLYASINNWMQPFIDKGLIRIQRVTASTSISEEYIGMYDVDRLDIYLGKELISLIPKGTLIIGSYGRVDMRAPKGEIMIIEPEWNQWKFAQRTPKLQTWAVTEESFKNAILDLA